MLYQSSRNWEAAPHKRVLLFGMSGLGRTFVSNMLRASGDWFHYSVDYHVGTRYMGEFIADSFKGLRCRSLPAFAFALNSIYIASNITFDNLAPLSMYLGKPGDADKGGLPFAEYIWSSQNQHRSAEIAALLDTQHFIKKATDIYQYDHFVCDEWWIYL